MISIETDDCMGEYNALNERGIESKANPKSAPTAQASERPLRQQDLQRQLDHRGRVAGRAEDEEGDRESDDRPDAGGLEGAAFDRAGDHGAVAWRLDVQLADRGALGLGAAALAVSYWLARRRAA
jgi:hypothetical protein